MPKSRVRQRAVYTPPPRRSAAKKPSAPWVGVVMSLCFLVGIGWLAAYYVTGGDVAVLDSLGNFNLVVGFALIVVGFGLATRWR